MIYTKEDVVSGACYAVRSEGFIQDRKLSYYLGNAARGTRHAVSDIYKRGNCPSSWVRCTPSVI